MAHERTELALGPGVNALTGPNNTGKSAVVEALRCVATNPVPKHYIRHGAKEARVSLEFDDGFRIVWIRKKRSSGYELWHPGAEEPEEYWKFGRKPPEDVLAVLRLDLVELETGGEVDVHVGNQREPVFLLNQPASNAAAFFAASTESAHLLAMQNLLKRRTQESSRQERELKGRLSSIEEEMNAFSPLPDIEMELESARALESLAGQLQSEMPALDNVIGQYKSFSSNIGQLNAKSVILQETRPAPKLSDNSCLSSNIRQIGSIGAAQETAQAVAHALAPLTSPPIVHDTAGLATTCRHLQQLDRSLQLARSRAQAVGQLHDPPALVETGRVAAMRDEVLASLYRLRREENRVNVLKSIVDPPQLQPLVGLEALLGEVHAMAGEKQQGEAALAQLENGLETLKKEIATRVEAMGCCPTCGADINTEAFLDRRCRHDG